MILPPEDNPTSVEEPEVLPDATPGVAVEPVQPTEPPPSPVTREAIVPPREEMTDLELDAQQNFTAAERRALLGHYHRGAANIRWQGVDSPQATAYEQLGMSVDEAIGLFQSLLLEVPASLELHGWDNAGAFFDKFTSESGDQWRNAILNMGEWAEREQLEIATRSEIYGLFQLYSENPDNPTVARALVGFGDKAIDFGGGIIIWAPAILTKNRAVLQTTIGLMATQAANDAKRKTGSSGIALGVFALEVVRLNMMFVGVGHYMGRTKQGMTAELDALRRTQSARSLDDIAASLSSRVRGEGVQAEIATLESAGGLAGAGRWAARAYREGRIMAIVKGFLEAQPPAVAQFLKYSGAAASTADLLQQMWVNHYEIDGKSNAWLTVPEKLWPTIRANLGEGFGLIILNASFMAVGHIYSRAEWRQAKTPQQRYDLAVKNGMALYRSTRLRDFLTEEYTDPTGAGRARIEGVMQELYALRRVAALPPPEAEMLGALESRMGLKPGDSLTGNYQLVRTAQDETVRYWEYVDTQTGEIMWRDSARAGGHYRQPLTAAEFDAAQKAGGLERDITLIQTTPDVARPAYNVMNDHRKSDKEEEWTEELTEELIADPKNITSDPGGEGGKLVVPKEKAPAEAEVPVEAAPPRNRIQEAVEHSAPADLVESPADLHAAFVSAAKNIVTRLPRVYRMWLNNILASIGNLDMDTRAFSEATRKKYLDMYQRVAAGDMSIPYDTSIDGQVSRLRKVQVTEESMKGEMKDPDLNVDPQNVLEALQAIHTVNSIYALQRSLNARRRTERVDKETQGVADETARREPNKGRPDLRKKRTYKEDDVLVRLGFRRAGDKKPIKSVWGGLYGVYMRSSLLQLTKRLADKSGGVMYYTFYLRTRKILGQIQADSEISADARRAAFRNMGLTKEELIQLSDAVGSPGSTGTTTIRVQRKNEEGRFEDIDLEISYGQLEHLYRTLMDPWNRDLLLNEGVVKDAEGNTIGVERAGIYIKGTHDTWDAEAGKGGGFYLTEEMMRKLTDPEFPVGERDMNMVAFEVALYHHSHMAYEVRNRLSDHYLENGLPDKTHDNYEARKWKMRPEARSDRERGEIPEELQQGLHGDNRASVERDTGIGKDRVLPEDAVYENFIEIEDGIQQFDRHVQQSSALARLGSHFTDLYSILYDPLAGEGSMGLMELMKGTEGEFPLRQVEQVLRNITMEVLGLTGREDAFARAARFVRRTSTAGMLTGNLRVAMAQFTSVVLTGHYIPKHILTTSMGLAAAARARGDGSRQAGIVERANRNPYLRERFNGDGHRIISNSGEGGRALGMEAVTAWERWEDISWSGVKGFDSAAVYRIQDGVEVWVSDQLERSLTSEATGYRVIDRFTKKDRTDEFAEVARRLIDPETGELKVDLYDRLVAELVNEWVIDVLVRTQPTFDALHDDFVSSLGKTNATLGLFLMFRAFRNKYVTHVTDEMWEMKREMNETGKFPLGTALSLTVTSMIMNITYVAHYEKYAHLLGRKSLFGDQDDPDNGKLGLWIRKNIETLGAFIPFGNIAPVLEEIMAMIDDSDGRPIDANSSPVFRVMQELVHAVAESPELIAEYRKSGDLPELLIQAIDTYEVFGIAAGNKNAVVNVLTDILEFVLSSEADPSSIPSGRMRPIERRGRPKPENADEDYNTITGGLR